MQLEKIIGFSLDTNQFSSKPIENKKEAKAYLDKVIGLYGKEVLGYMFLTKDKRFTTYQKDGISLSGVLKIN
jgi:hypothetical protein